MRNEIEAFLIIYLILELAFLILGGWLWFTNLDFHKRYSGAPTILPEISSIANAWMSIILLIAGNILGVVALACSLYILKQVENEVEKIE